MLKGISKILSPELLKILMEMGHTDEIVISDGNFPAGTYSQRLVRLDGHNVPEVLEAILKLFPLDTYVEKPVALMEVVKGDPIVPTIWEEYRKIVKSSHDDFTDFEYMDKWDFYERSKKAYAVVVTGESALYANILIKKGVVTE
ncbi:fucose isomerase [Clostridium beijerinckii]|uniref:Fucose isomerase n=1 Tax=Clostridium beijerinckii TaxID=1520 RepID=A0A0B5QIE2_CLOBE|nr:L-fucose mutarotase [Clostridium beijerinckii]AJH00701.1 fucose isomerase [Clostridium beijerinckii]